MKTTPARFGQYWLILFVIIFATTRLAAQPFYPVNYGSGTQQVGGRLVTVVPINGALGGTSGVPNGPCFINWYAHSTAYQGTLFSFSKPVHELRFNIEHLDASDTLQFFINGSHYFLSMANLQGPICNWSGNAAAMVSTDGNLVCYGPLSVDFTARIISIQSASPIDSTRIMAKGFFTNYGLRFAGDTLVHIPEPVNDSVLCAGDSLKLPYYTTGRFKSNNSFTVQLSNASGSFASPVNIGSKAADTTDTIACFIPAVTATGTGYKLRIIATNPIDTSDLIPGTLDIGNAPPPGLNASGTSPVCSGGNISLGATSSGSGSYTWGWTGPGSYSSALQNPTLTNVTTAQSGNYIVTASLYGCRSKDTVAITVNQTPLPVTAGANTPLCEGSTLNLTSTNSTAGASYSWTGPASYTAGVQNPSRTGTTTAHSGDYVVTATLPGGCTAKDTVTVLVKPMPATPSALNNSPLCPGDSLGFVSASTTAGVSYSWSGPNSYSSLQQNPYILNVQSTHAGVYTVTATLNGCSSPNTTTVVVKPKPSAPVAGSNTPVCPNTPINLTATTVAGASYNWIGPSSFTSNLQNPVIATASAANAGNYTVTATVNGCVSTPAQTTVVVATPAAPYSAGSNSPVCAGGTLNLTVSNMSGATFTWQGPNGFSSAAQNPSVFALTSAGAGTYSVYATVNGCVYPAVTTSIAVSTVSSVGAYPSPNDTLCQMSTNATFVAVPNNGGSSPQYQWFKNGTLLIGATGLSFPATAIANGDTFYCRMTATGVCTDPLVLFSNKIGMTVLPTALPPAITISANPSTPLSPWQTVTFTAIPAGNAGSTPVYQWKRNGSNIIGATSNTWSANNLADNDEISCEITSSEWCANPAKVESSKIAVHIKTGINDIAGNRYRIYPNPVTNELMIEAEVGMKLSVVNMLGQEVYSGVLRNSKEIINTSGFAPGSYVLQLMDNEGDRNTVKLQKQ